MGTANATLISQIEVRAAQPKWLANLRPVAQTATHQAALAADSSALSSTPHLVQDQRFPNMWRIAIPDGRLSNMVNITRAKDALALAKRRSSRADR